MSAVGTFQAYVNRLLEEPEEQQLSLPLPETPAPEAQDPLPEPRHGCG